VAQGEISHMEENGAVSPAPRSRTCQERNAMIEDGTGDSKRSRGAKSADDVRPHPGPSGGAYTEKRANAVPIVLSARRERGWGGGGLRRHHRQMHCLRPVHDPPFCTEARPPGLALRRPAAARRLLREARHHKRTAWRGTGQPVRRVESVGTSPVTTSLSWIVR